MSDWSPADLTRVAAAAEVEISTRRPDGTLRTPVPIWVVRVGDEIYVRSYRGPDGAWYLHASRTGRARVRASGRDYDVRAEPAAPDTGDEIDRAYRAKYAAYGDTYVRPMIAGPARQATLRLRPPQHPTKETGETT